jgi:hypothetical protein
MVRQQQLWRILTLVLVVVFVLGGLALAPGISNPSNTLTPGTPTTPAVVFPAVPPGGTHITADYTYFHSSGLFSLPHLVGWDPAPSGQGQGAESRIEPAGTPGTPGSSQVSLAGVTFINSQALSVVHAYVEKDPARAAQSFDQLSQYYTPDILRQAWVNFTGGWKELNRHAEGDVLVINFELYLDNSTYLARQLSRFDQGWLMILRLVVPGNNPTLLDQLQQAVMPGYRLWPQTLTTPLSWNAVVDYAAGYLIRYPPDWQVVDGSPNRPFTVAGTLGADTITLTTRAEPGKAVKTEDEARTWIKTNWPNATVQTVKPETRGDVSGFSVSYINPDADGNKRCAVATLLNGANGTLYIANEQSSARDQNLLDETNQAIPPDLARIRSSFTVLPVNQLVPTLTPSPTPIPSVTPTSAVPASLTPERPTPTPMNPSDVGTAASTAASTTAAPLPATSLATVAPVASQAATGNTG